MAFENLAWTRTIGARQFLISTDPALLQPSSINSAFALPELYWTQPLPEAQLQLLLSNSLCLGLYEQYRPQTETEGAAAAAAHRSQIGLRRLVTDRVTFAYTTDFYVVPSARGLGLGRWLHACTRELLAAMEGGWARRGVRGMRTVTPTREANAEWYCRELGMRRVVQGDEGGLVFLQRCSVWADEEGNKEGEGRQESREAS